MFKKHWGLILVLLTIIVGCSYSFSIKHKKNSADEYQPISREIPKTMWIMDVSKINEDNLFVLSRYYEPTICTKSFSFFLNLFVCPFIKSKESKFEENSFIYNLVENKYYIIKDKEMTNNMSRLVFRNGFLLLEDGTIYDFRKKIKHKLPESKMIAKQRVKKVSDYEFIAFAYDDKEDFYTLCDTRKLKCKAIKAVDGKKFTIDKVIKLEEYKILIEKYDRIKNPIDTVISTDWRHKAEIYNVTNKSQAGVIIDDDSIISKFYPFSESIIYKFPNIDLNKIVFFELKNGSYTKTKEFVIDCVETEKNYALGTSYKISEDEIVIHVENFKDPDPDKSKMVLIYNVKTNKVVKVLKSPNIITEFNAKVFKIDKNRWFIFDETNKYTTLTEFIKKERK